MQHLLIRIGNHFMKLILRSPLHSLVSENAMIITSTGRKSGKIYTTPVNYVRDAGALIILSQDDRTWWKNLRGGDCPRQGHRSNHGPQAPLAMCQ
jgi:hypothetical protein